MSLFDQIYRSYAVPSLMHYMGDAAAVTIIIGNETIVDQADAIIRHEETTEEVYDSGIRKRIEREVDVLRVDLPDNVIRGRAIVMEPPDEVGVVYSIDRIVSRTAQWVRLALVRKEPTESTRTGYRRGE